MRRRQVRVNGETLEGLDLDFEIKREEWNEYRLLDGGTVRIKTTPLRIVRVLDKDGKPAYTADGDPHIAVSHNTQVVSSEGT